MVTRRLIGLVAASIFLSACDNAAYYLGLRSKVATSEEDAQSDGGFKRESDDIQRVVDYLDPNLSVIRSYNGDEVVEEFDYVLSSHVGKELSDVLLEDEVDMMNLVVFLVQNYYPRDLLVAHEILTETRLVYEENFDFKKEAGYKFDRETILEVGFGMSLPATVPQNSASLTTSDSGALCKKVPSGKTICFSAEGSQAVSLGLSELRYLARAWGALTSQGEWYAGDILFTFVGNLVSNVSKEDSTCDVSADEEACGIKPQEPTLPPPPPDDDDD